MTLDKYSHVTPGMQRDAANALDRFIEQSGAVAS
jgi:hypothetical protein